MLALSLAGLVNMAMVAMAATMFHQGHSDVGEIETAYHTLLPLMGVVAAGAFMTSLLASGLSSSVVGTMAGQVIMQDFVGFRIPLWVRRAVTMVPAVMVVAMGVQATDALVMSQVVLSLVLPVPMIALLVLIRRPEVMARLRDRARRCRCWRRWRPSVVLALNVILLLQSFVEFRQTLGAIDGQMSGLMAENSDPLLARPSRRSRRRPAASARRAPPSPARCWRTMSS